MIAYFLKSSKHHHQIKLRLLQSLPKLAVTLLAISLLSACKPDNVSDGVTNKYFNIKGYFANSVKQLEQRHNKIISKTVTHNGASESRNVQIKNWAIELALFSESDINKPAWRNSYSIISNHHQLIYTAKYPELKTRRIVISKAANGKVLSIKIDNQISNTLYKTSERLVYVPDSAYIIEKHQKILLLGANNYKIAGRFN